MTEISVRMQVVIEKLNEENATLKAALDNANDAIARLEKALNDKMMERIEELHEWQDGYDTGERQALGSLLRYVVAKLGRDADEELDKLAGERQQEGDSWPVPGVSLNEWEWWSEDNPIRYSQPREGLTLADYTEGCNQ